MDHRLGEVESREACIALNFVLESSAMMERHLEMAPVIGLILASGPSCLGEIDGK